MPVTPFRRTIDAALLEHPAPAERPLPPGGVDKWEALRELSASRKVYGLSDRELSVLQALVSFHPNRTLDPRDGPLIVYPSNSTICRRLNGMPCSTMRRHLSRLVTAGMVIRRDSPNGKRYTRRYGGEKIAFGFDLTPLVARFQEFCEEAHAIREAEAHLRHKREIVSLMRRDLDGLIHYWAVLGPDRSAWQRLSDLVEDATRVLRRKPRITDLTTLETRLREALREVRQDLCAGDLSTSDAHPEQHHQSLEEEDNTESAPVRLPSSREIACPTEPHLWKDNGPLRTADNGTSDGTKQRTVVQGSNCSPQCSPSLELRHVLAVCPSIIEVSQFPVRRWHDLIRAADILVPMLGISPRIWDQARAAMGVMEAATVIAVMLERSAEIRSPGAYFRRLSEKACTGAFSPGPMLRSLTPGARSSQL